MTVQFAAPWLLFLVWPVLAGGALLVVVFRRRTARINCLFGPEMRQKLCPPPVTGRFHLQLGLLLAGFPLLGDACLCVLRRWQAGQPIFQAHRLHLYQRLHQAGWPHDRVALLYIGATALLGWALLVQGLALELGLLGVELAVGLWLDRHHAVPFSP